MGDDVEVDDGVCATTAASIEEDVGDESAGVVDEDDIEAADRLLPLLLRLSSAAEAPLLLLLLGMGWWDGCDEP